MRRPVSWVTEICDSLTTLSANEPYSPNNTASVGIENSDGRLVCIGVERSKQRPALCLERRFEFNLRRCLREVDDLRTLRKYYVSLLSTIVGSAADGAKPFRAPSG